MPYTKVDFRPGINKDFTQLTGEGAFYDCEKVRFRDGLAENIGGWRKALDDTVTGIPRSGHSWATNTGLKVTAIGTSKKLYVHSGGAFHDITPIRDSGTLGADPFSMTSGSAVVTVTDANHGLGANEYVHFSGAAAAGGITVEGEYSVTSVTDSGHYTITHSSQATSTTTGGGAVVAYQYEIAIGIDSSIYGYGWGAGTWGMSTWGTARSSSDIKIGLRIWTLDNWGEDLLCMPRGGNLYVWDASAGTATRATVVTQAPTGEFFIVDPENRTVIVFGEDDDSVGIKWCDQNDYTNWTASAATTADERRLLKGAKIIGAVRTSGEILVWTDVSLHGLQWTYRGDFVYALRTIGEQCGLIGINAAATHGTTVWWMSSNKNFYVYDGRVRILSCPLRKDVFDNLTVLQSDKVFAGINSGHMEVWWFWQSGDGSENDRYTIYNFGEGTWYHGTMERTAWIDKGILEYPVALDGSGYLREHEVGKNDDGAALESWVESGDFDIGDGDDIMFVGGIIPDFVLSGTVRITMKARKFPNTEQITKGPIDVDSSKGYIRPRIRGRQIAVRIGSNEVDASWRFGRLRFDIQPDGEN